MFSFFFVVVMVLASYCTSGLVSTGMGKGKGKVFLYSLPSVGPGADLGVQAVSPQVT